MIFDEWLRSRLQYEPPDDPGPQESEEELAEILRRAREREADGG